MYIAALSNHIAIITVPGLIFYLGLKDHFLENAVSRRPLLLLWMVTAHILSPNLFSLGKKTELLSSAFHPTPHTSVSPLMLICLDPLRDTGSRNATSSIRNTSVTVSPCKHLWRIQKRWCLSLQSKCSADA